MISVILQDTEEVVGSSVIFSQLEVLRRIAERGLKLNQDLVKSQVYFVSSNVDLWQHMLDEIERTKQQYENERFPNGRFPSS